MKLFIAKYDLSPNLGQGDQWGGEGAHMGLFCEAESHVTR